jgi:hypothetical protein
VFVAGDLLLKENIHRLLVRRFWTVTAGDLLLKENIHRLLLRRFWTVTAGDVTAVILKKNEIVEGANFVWV